MKKIPSRKLSLRTETLVNLTPAHLHQVNGGWTTIVIVPNFTTMTIPQLSQTCVSQGCTPTTGY
jgi:hypothetical protein